jgi:hypothetical protein
VAEFREQGVLVVRGAIEPAEVRAARDGLHAVLKARAGVDVEDLEATAGGLRALSSTGGAGGVLDLFYEPFQMRLATSPVCFGAMSQLWGATFASGSDPSFRHRHGPFDPAQGFCYLDRVCYRVSERISLMHSAGGASPNHCAASKRKTRPLQRSLTPHLDCCPVDMQSAVQGGKAVAKWRPVQAFVSLTDTTEAEEGGFEAARGFHLDFDAWAESRPLTRGAPPKSRQQQPGHKHQASTPASQSTKPAPCIGEFTPLRPREDANVLARVAHVGCVRAGDLVLWDNRVPHSNSRFNHSGHSREVVFLGFLPAVPLNERFASDQRGRWERDVCPGDQWVEAGLTASGARQTTGDFAAKGADTVVAASDVECAGARIGRAKEEPADKKSALTPLGRRLMAIDPWS